MDHASQVRGNPPPTPLLPGVGCSVYALFHAMYAVSGLYALFHGMIELGLQIFMCI